MLPRRLADECLIARRPARGIGLFQKVVHQILIQSNRDSRLAARLWLLGRNPSPLPPGEILLFLHLFIIGSKHSTDLPSCRHAPLLPCSLFPAPSLPALTDAAAHTARITPIITSDSVTGTSIHRAASIFSAAKTRIAPNP